MVVSELRGEKIDIIPWNPEPARFVAKALSPARVREVLVDDETSEATVVVPDDQLSLAIGKEGLNARLAARLTGWKIDIVSETEFAQAEAEAAFGGDEEEFSGRCAAILANGKRCPNTALPGSRYCGIPAHRELAAKEAAGEVVQPAVAVTETDSDATPADESGRVEEEQIAPSEADAVAAATETEAVETERELGAEAAAAEPAPAEEAAGAPTEIESRDGEAAASGEAETAEGETAAAS
jgi:N utilization substance protein A